MPTDFSLAALRLAPRTRVRRAPLAGDAWPRERFGEARAIALRREEIEPASPDRLRPRHPGDLFAPAVEEQDPIAAEGDDQRLATLDDLLVTRLRKPELPFEQQLLLALEQLHLGDEGFAVGLEHDRQLEIEDLGERPARALLRLIVARVG